MDRSYRGQTSSAPIPMVHFLLLPLLNILVLSPVKMCNAVIFLERMATTLCKQENVALT